MKHRTCQCLLSTVPKKIFSVIFFLLLFFVFGLLSSTKVIAQELPDCPLTIKTDPPVNIDNTNHIITAKPSEFHTITYDFDLSQTQSTLGSAHYITGGYLYINHDISDCSAFSDVKIKDTNDVANNIDDAKIAKIIQHGITTTYSRSVITSPFCYKFFDPYNNFPYAHKDERKITLTVKYYKDATLDVAICKPVTYKVILPRRACKIEPCTQNECGIFNIENDGKYLEIKDIIYDDFHNCIETKINGPTTKAVWESISQNNQSIEIPLTTGEFGQAGNYTADVYQGTSKKAGIYTVGCEPETNRKLCSGSFEIAARGATPLPPPPTLTPNPTCIPCITQARCTDECLICPGCGGDIKADLKPICEALPTGFLKKCEECQTPGSGTIWTAIGCVPADTNAFVKQYIFTYGVGIAGGFAFLYFLFAAFTILTSAGNPERIEEAKQMIVSSLSGLLLIIFSVVILKFIGVDILDIPGWNTTAPPAPTPTIYIPIITRGPTPELCSGECVKLSESCQSGYQPDSSKQCDPTSISRGYKKCCEPLPTSSPKPTRSGIPTDSPSTNTPTPLHTPTPFPTLTNNACSDPNGTIVGCPIITSKPCFSGGGDCKVNQQCDGADKDGKCNYFCYNSENKLTPCDSSYNIDPNYQNKCQYLDTTDNQVKNDICPSEYSQDSCKDGGKCYVYRECGYVNNGNWCQYFCYRDGKKVDCF